MSETDVLTAKVFTSVAASLSAALVERATRVEAAIDALLPRTSRAEGRLVDAMRYASLGGGKRLRGFLVMEIASVLGVAEATSAKVAASVEMLHAYSLIHDDLPAMDNDDMRRGQASTHRAFGEATAILAGDALQTQAFEVVASLGADVPSHIRCDLVLALAHASGMDGMVGGQMIDMQAEGSLPSLAEVMRLQALKTGRLIQYSAEAGAILAGAEPAIRRTMAEYGRALGAAFQIADDVLDATGDAEVLGKSTGKDAAVGKATVVALLGVERAKAEARALAGHAAGQLAGFGAEADLLRALTTYVVERRS